MTLMTKLREVCGRISTAARKAGDLSYAKTIDELPARRAQRTDAVTVDDVRRVLTVELGAAERYSADTARAWADLAELDGRDVHADSARGLAPREFRADANSVNPAVVIDPYRYGASARTATRADRAAGHRADFSKGDLGREKLAAAAKLVLEAAAFDAADATRLKAIVAELQNMSNASSSATGRIDSARAPLPNSYAATLTADERARPAWQRPLPNAIAR